MGDPSPSPRKKGHKKGISFPVITEERAPKKGISVPVITEEGVVKKGKSPFLRGLRGVP